MHKKHILLLSALNIFTNCFTAHASHILPPKQFFIGIELMHNTPYTNIYGITQKVKSPSQLDDASEQSFSVRRKNKPISFGLTGGVYLNDIISLGGKIEYINNSTFKSELTPIKDTPALLSLAYQWSSQAKDHFDPLGLYKAYKDFIHNSPEEGQSISKASYITKQTETHKLTYHLYYVMPRIQVDLLKYGDLSFFTALGAGIANIKSKITSSYYAEGYHETKLNGQSFSKENFTRNYTESTNLRAKRNLAISIAFGVSIPLSPQTDIYGSIEYKTFGKIPNTDKSIAFNCVGLGLKFSF